MKEGRKSDDVAPGGVETKVEPLDFDASWVAGGLNPQPLPPRHDVI
jgi:hypothetical protein